MSTSQQHDTDRKTLAAANITNLSPDTGKSSGGYLVTISGTELGNVTTVIFGTNLATNVKAKDTTVTCNAPAGPMGTVQVKVADKYGNPSNELPFAYVAG